MIGIHQYQTIMENLNNGIFDVNSLLLGSAPSLSMGLTMMASAHAQNMLSIQSVQQSQQAHIVQLSNTSKCVIDVLNQGKYSEIMKQVISTLS